MNISNFDELLQAARQQPDAQRLLMVFVGAQAFARQRRRTGLAASPGEAGELTPLMCVDKTPKKLSDFATLSAEAEQFRPARRCCSWPACRARAARPQHREQAQAPLERHGAGHQGWPH